MKKALVIRLGAFGDMIMATPLFKKLKEEGYHVTLNCKKPQSDATLKGNPYIDRYIYHDDSIPNKSLGQHWAELGKGYDKVVNLSESIERFLLKMEGDPEFNWSAEKRHGFCNINYYDHTMSWAGYDDKGTNGEIFISLLEAQEAKRFMRKHSDKFVILWSLSGSSYHKAYPYFEYVMQSILQREDVLILAVGDSYCEMFEEGLHHPRIKNYIGKWSMRKSIVMTKYVDCVVGTDTGLLVAAGCFDTPKVLLLSHTSKENLTKYWKNVTALQSGVECQPCHRLIYTLEACPLDYGLRSPLCMARLPAQSVFDAIDHYYQEKKNGLFRRSGEPAVFCGGRRYDLGFRKEAAAV